MKLDEIIDFETASKLKGFHFRLPATQKGLKQGIHSTSVKGVSPDFFEYKEYSPGDDPKHIDWRAYGRFDKLYVKKFEDEVTITWCILIDKSGSMGYGSGKVEKLDYALSLAATFGYLLAKQGDAVSIGHFNRDGLDINPPKYSVSNLIPSLENLQKIHADGSTDLKNPVIQSVEAVKNSTAFVIVSDFLADIEVVKNMLKTLRSMRKEVIAFHVLDPRELSFAFTEPHEFEDMEDGSTLVVDPEDVRELYKKKASEFVDTLKAVCNETGVRYVLSLTDNPLDEILIRVASK